MHNCDAKDEYDADDDDADDDDGNDDDDDDNDDDGDDVNLRGFEDFLLKAGWRRPLHLHQGGA